MLKFLKKKNKKEKPFVSAIIAAGGTSSRMGENKLMIELDDIPVLGHTLLAIDRCEMIDEIIIVAHRDYIVEYGQLAIDLKIKKIKAVVAGGNTRTESVFNGINNTSSNCKFVLIHDGARPFVTNDELISVMLKAFTSGAATAGVAVKDSIKKIENDKIIKTVERTNLIQVQTPQVFDADLIKGALANVIVNNIAVTDDCQAVEIIGFSPSIVFTSYDNIKITTREDIFFGQAILNKRGDNYENR